MNLPSHRAHLGFTLIELMITVAIIAIITALALPTYRESVARSKRSEATVLMQEAAQYLQRYYSANDSYTNTLPTILSNVPRGVTSGQTYTISVVTNSNSTTYTITAVATGTQATDKCGNYILTAQGTRSNSTSAADCWK